MFRIIEEIEEIKRITRVVRNRRPRTVYYIHAALRTWNSPASLFEKEIWEDPAYILDLSSTPFEKQYPSIDVSYSHPFPAPPFFNHVIPLRSPHRERAKEKHSSPPPIWKDDLVALRALSILDLDETATLTDIKKRWRKLAQKLHPDKGGNAETFIRARTAYETLIARSRSKSP